MALTKLEQVVRSAEYLDALKQHLSGGLLAVYPGAITEISSVAVELSMPDDSAVVLVTLKVRPAFT